MLRCGLDCCSYAVAEVQVTVRLCCDKVHMRNWVLNGHSLQQGRTFSRASDWLAAVHSASTDNLVQHESVSSTCIVYAWNPDTLMDRLAMTSGGECKRAGMQRGSLAPQDWMLQLQEAASRRHQEPSTRA